MTTQPEALRLANRLESGFIWPETELAAAAELRWLHAQNKALLEALEAVTYCLQWHTRRSGNLADDTAINLARAAIKAAEERKDEHHHD